MEMVRSHARRASLAFVFLLGATGLGCTAAPPTCLVGESRGCTCTDGRTGAQICGTDRTLGPCTCESVSDAGLADSAEPDSPAPEMDAPAPMDAPDGAGLLIDFDAALGVTTFGGRVVTWADQSGNGHHATTTSALGPTVATAIVNGAPRTVLRFDGSNYLTAEPTVPTEGTIVIIVGPGAPSTYSFGWDTTNAVGLMPSYDRNTYLIVRERGAVSDLNGGFAITEIECDVISWGPAGVTLERHLPNGTTLRFMSTAVRGLTTTGGTLNIASPPEGPGTSQPLVGDIAAFRAYERQLDRDTRDAIAREMFGEPIGFPDAGPPPPDAGMPTAVCVPYLAALEGPLRDTVTMAVDGCAATPACTSCRAAGGRGPACGPGETLERCILDCIAVNATTLNDAIAAGEIDLACVTCFADVPDCRSEASCLACPDPGCSCAVCECGRGCVDRFTSCSGLRPYLDCTLVTRTC